MGLLADRQAVQPRVLIRLLVGPGTSRAKQREFFWQVDQQVDLLHGRLRLHRRLGGKDREVESFVRSRDRVTQLQDEWLVRVLIDERDIEFVLIASLQGRRGGRR